MTVKSGVATSLTAEDSWSTVTGALSKDWLARIIFILQALVSFFPQRDGLKGNKVSRSRKRMIQKDIFAPFFYLHF